MSQEEKKSQDTLNKDAKEFVPSKNRVPQNLKFNLDAKEYEYKPKDKPKEKIEYVEADDDDENNDEQVKEEIDMMMHDEIENEVMDELANQGHLEDDDSADEDKWLPKYKDCGCCHGFVYKCKGEACSALGQCYCKMKDDVDIEDDANKDSNTDKDKN